MELCVLCGESSNTAKIQPQKRDVKFSGGIFLFFLFGKADFRNIQKVAGNREGDAVFVLKFSLFLGSGGGGEDRFQRFQFSVSWFADARLEQ